MSLAGLAVLLCVLSSSSSPLERQPLQANAAHLLQAEPAPLEVPSTVIPRFGNGDMDLVLDRASPPYEFNTNRRSIISASATTVVVTGGAGTFNAGNIVLFHQTQGPNAGQVEFNRVIRFDGNVWTLSRRLRHTYTTGGSAVAQLVRVEQYRTISVSPALNDAVPTITAPKWDGSTGGILVFMVKNNVNGTLSLNMQGRGFFGGYGNDPELPGGGNICPDDSSGTQGDAPSGTGNCTAAANGGGGGAGEQGGSDPHWGSGGGGGHGTAGGVGRGPHPGAAGTTYGSADLSTIHMGAGGGGGAWRTNPYGGGRGSIGDNRSDDVGRGGGIIWVQIGGGARFIYNTQGSTGGKSLLISPNFPFIFGGYSGGGGAGGSIKTLSAYSGSTSGDPLAAIGGGVGGEARLEPGGSGGQGRMFFGSCASPGVGLVQIDCAAPVTDFSQLVEPYQPYGSNIVLRWSAEDISLPIQVTLHQQIGDEPYFTPVDGTDARELTIQANRPCQVYKFQLTAIDAADNESAPKQGSFQVGLQGDINENKVIDDADVAAIEAKLGLRTGDPSFEPPIDINGNGVIDSADAQWVRLRIGDTCPQRAFIGIVPPSTLPSPPVPLLPPVPWNGPQASILTPGQVGRAVVNEAVDLVFPEAAVATETIIEATEVLTIPIQLPSGQRLVYGFELEAEQFNGQVVTHFAEPYALRIDHQDTSVQKAYRIFYWDETNAQWIEVPTQFQPSALRTVGYLDHFTLFIVTEDQQQPAQLPMSVYLPLID
jgi:hypothetical protein